MKTFSIENIITDEILSKYNANEFDCSDFVFEFDYDVDTIVEVTGSIRVEVRELCYDYYTSVGDEYEIISVDADITKVEFFNEDGLIPMRIDLAKINRLIEMDIR